MDIKKNQTSREYISNQVLKRLHKEYTQAHDSIKIAKQHIISDIVGAYSDDEDHKKRLEGYFQKQYFWCSTPILSNVPKKNMKYYGSNIACFLLEINNNNFSQMLYSISEITSIGAGIGVLLDLPSVSEEINGKLAHSFIQYVKTIASTMRINAGKARSSGSLCVYMNIDHLDIEEFIGMRKNKHGSDPENFIPTYIHHGIIIGDDFMKALREDTPWGLKNSQGKVIKTVSPRSLMIKIINTRFETGEPYIMFKDNVNRAVPDIYKALGFDVKVTNLCTEIVEKTGLDHLGLERIAICCLGSLNLSKYDEWSHMAEQMLEDILRMYDNIMTYFICFSPKYKVGDIIQEDIKPGWLKNWKKEEKNIVDHSIKHNHPLAKAIYGAIRGRDLGLGVCGFTHLLQKKQLLVDSQEAIDYTKKLFDHINGIYQKLNYKLGEELGPCLDGIDAKINKRFTHITAIAPTSTLAAHLDTSRSIEQDERLCIRKTNEGSNIVINKYLEDKLLSNGVKSTNQQINQIKNNSMGIFKEIDYKLTKGGYSTNQLKFLKLISTIKVDQSISFNTWFTTESNRSEIVQHFISSWKLGYKTLYYSFGKAFSNQSSWKDQDENDGEDQLIDCPTIGEQECSLCE